MKKIQQTPRYERDFKRVSKYPKFNLKEFEGCLKTLAEGNQLDPKYADHKMGKTSPKEYQGCKDFHLKSNICVIYRMDSETITLIRIGSHQDLNLTEGL